MKKRLIMLCLLCAVSNIAYAQTEQSEVKSSAVVKNEVGESEESRLVIESFEQKFWGLNEAEWLLYQKVKPIAAQLSKAEGTPPEVLGIFARTEQERERYAKLFAQKYVQYVDSSIVSMRLVRQELRKLNEGRTMFDYAMLNELRGDKIGVNDRVQFFTKTVCSDCDARLAQLVNQVRYYKVKLDIFVVDDVSDEQLQAYAELNVPRDLAESGYITLNRDKTFVTTHKIKVPAAFISVDNGPLQVHEMK